MTRRLLFPLLAVPALLIGQQPTLVEGNAKSPVKVIIYEDLQCSDCADFRRMMDEKLLPKYASNVAFEHREFPLAKHAWARRASAVARSIQMTSPEAALAFRRQIMASQKQITPENLDAFVTGFAKKQKLDGAKLLADAADPKVAALVEQDFQEGVARGVSKTPTVFVNGEPFVETFTFEEISKSIDRALAP